MTEPHHAAARLRTDDEQVVLAHLSRVADLRAQGCTCTPGRLMDNRGPIYVEDATCPIHGTGPIDRGAA